MNSHPPPPPVFALTRYFAIIVLMVIALYLLTASLTRRMDQERVPSGHSFSYATNYFYAFNDAKHSYINSLLTNFSRPGGAWLQRGMVALLTPLCIKERYSLMIINFCFFGLVICQLFRLSMRFGHQPEVALVIALSFWWFPWHYQSEFSPLSLADLSQETSFNLMYLSACCSWIIFCIEPKNRRECIFAGLLSGMALWGRGNSLPFLLISIAVPNLIILRSIFNANEQSKDISRNLVICWSIFGLMTAWLYHRTLAGIFEFYSLVSPIFQESDGVFSKLLISLKNSGWILTSIPGSAMVFKNIEHSHPWLLTVLSFASHGIVLAGTLMVFNKTLVERTNSIALKVCSTTGTFIYFFTFVFGLFSFGAYKDFRPYAFFYALAPMLTGLGLSVIALGSVLFQRFTPSFIQWPNKLRAISVIAFILLTLAYGRISWEFYMPSPLQYSGAATPQQIKQVALNFEKITRNGSVKFIWYYLYNTQILEHYRIQEGLPALSNILSDFDHNLYHASALNEPDELRFTFRSLIRKADFLILPELLVSYEKIYNYPMRKFAKSLADALNEPNAPLFQIRMILHDRDQVRLLLVERITQDINQNTHYPLLPLPWGKPLPPDILAFPDILSDTHLEKYIASQAPLNLTSGIATASTPDAKNLIDGIIQPASMWDAGLGGWWKYDFGPGVSKVISRYMMYGWDSSLNGPTTWSFEGSNDGVNWKSLDSQKDVAWNDGEVKEFLISEPSAFRSYRLNITGAGKGKQARLMEMKLFEVYSHEATH